MNKLLFLLGTICLLGGCTQSTPPAVIPKPQEITLNKGEFSFSSQTAIQIENEEQLIIANQLAELFTQSAGFTPTIEKASLTNQKNYVQFETDTTFNTESYQLDISPTHIHIKAADNNGFFYAVQSLRLLLPPTIESKTTQQHIEWKVPALTLNDGPRFSYRGLMLDVARFFMPKENVMKIIDCMAMLKLNYLHFHLTDGNGWRLQIDKYPKLTEIGAWRVYRESDFSQRKNARKEEPTPVGGFYTKADIKEILAYAAARQITVIPEIEMPAHTNSSLAAYPELACPVVNTFIGVLPGMGGHEHTDAIVYCAGNDKVFSFLEDVIHEVADLFPSPYIHIGGDEASKRNWIRCPLCQQRMKTENITDPEDLQGYFMNRIASYVRSKGKQVIAWDEITNSHIPEGAIINGWRGLGQAGYKAGESGHFFIMSPARILYLPRYQGPQWFEPRTYFGNITLKDVYDYEPIQAEWKADVAANMIGIQGCLWTEFVNDPAHAEYMLFPRLIALAETAWSKKDTKDWNGFLKRLDILTQHLEYMDINYARSMFNLDHYISGTGEELKVSLSCIRSDMEIRYTRDESEPIASSLLYNDTLQIKDNVIIKAATFSKGQRKGEILRLPIEWNKSTAKPILSENKDIYRLTNGIRGSDKHTDFEWCGWHGEDFTFTIDLQMTQNINKIALGCITNYGMAVHRPRQVNIYISDDNKTFHPIEEKILTDSEIFQEGIRQEDMVFDNINASARYIKFNIINPGKCPADHVRPEQATWVYLDEIIIE